MDAKRVYPSRPLIGAGAVIVAAQRVLLVERGQPPMRGRWTVPGGLVEIGETLRQAARREAYEETGLDIEVGELLEVVDSIERDADGRIRFHFVIADFLARAAHPEAARAGGDAARLAWIGEADLARYPTTPGLAPLLAKALRRAAGG